MEKNWGDTPSATLNVIYFNRKKPDDPRILAQLITAYAQFDPEKAKLYLCDYIALIDVLKNDVFQELLVLCYVY